MYRQAYSQNRTTRLSLRFSCHVLRLLQWAKALHLPSPEMDDRPDESQLTFTDPFSEPSTQKLNASGCIFLWAREIFKNYSPTLRWIIVLVYTKLKIQMNVIWSKLSWKCDYLRVRPLWFANQWIVQNISSLSSQSGHAKTLFTSLVYTNLWYFNDKSIDNMLRYLR